MSHPRRQHLRPGSPHPLGATWDGSGVNFAVFSAHAEKIELCLFNPSGTRELERLALPCCTNEVWHGYLPHARLGQLYGLRAYGPYDPAHGQRFNPHKLLLDPYARQIRGELLWTDSLYGYRLGSARADLSFDRRDSAASMPKAVVIDSTVTPHAHRAPRVPWSQSVIYEAHVRGLSMLRADLPVAERGTFAGLGHPRSIEHLVKLGITAVELLPVQACVHDRRLIAHRLRNYWGYQTLAFFAPEPRYLADDLHEIRSTVQRLHEAGIEIILDVVYNHSGEGNERGPTLSLRGLDNRSYYRLAPGDERRYADFTGCGNTLDVSHPAVLQLVMDSLRWWVQAYGVDGFRFDLCTTLGRGEQDFDPHCAFFAALRQDPLLSRVKLIAEPWDLGPDGYQLGGHPPGFAEWNDRFRDDVRRFWRGDPGQRSALAWRLQGSSELFDHHARSPAASINFLTAHDGFTLRDLVSFEMPHNLANGENNHDGAAENWSRNWGVEGHTRDADICAQRARIQRALLATLLCSHGTPMLLAGDEFGRTQDGNNNAYCQDNRLSWIDWSLLDTEGGAALHAWTCKLIAARKRHPSLRSEQYLHGRDHPLPGIADVWWFDERGESMNPEAWEDGAAQCLVLRRACAISADEVEVGALLINGSQDAREFALPEPALDWILRLDSAAPQAPERALGHGVLKVGAQAVVLLTARLPRPSHHATP